MNKNKLYIALSLVAMAVLSLATAWIMSQNLQKDTSKLRFQLTKNYKKLKDRPYNFDMEQGQRIYNNSCVRCHGQQGQGSPSAPPLQGSQLIQTEPDKLLKIVVKGLQGPIERQGKQYNATMPAFGVIPETDLAHLLNYVRLKFGQVKEHSIDAIKVNAVKIEVLTKQGMYREAEL